MDYFELGFLGLFLAAFLSATIIPFASEGVFILFLLAGYDPLVAIVVASIGNTLGGVTNYGLGLLGNETSIRKRIKNPEKFERFSSWVKKYGAWLGLISWTPFIGDPITIFLGFFSVPFVPTLILMTIGKTCRYAVIAYLTL